MSTMNQIASGLYKAITESDSKKPVPYDTKAEVLRTDGDTVWVKIPGGIDETPVQKTNNAREGDTVMVRISGGRAWLLGNNTSPATDDTVAFKAQDTAITAIDVANTSKLAADIAEEAANKAVDSADKAEVAANRATNILNQMAEAAEAADTSLTQIYEDSKEAKEKTEIIRVTANNALAGLSIVEDVVGTLEWLAKHKTVTTDTTVQPDKIYFTYNETTGAVTRVFPTGTENPSELEWYEMSDAVANYVSTHLSLTPSGLWVVKDGTSAQVQINEAGMSIYPAGSSKPIATYGADAVIGDAVGFHITITANYQDSGNGRVSFYRDATNEVAYISGDSLYINKSVVVKEMNVGLPEGATDTSTGELGHGQWSWKVHVNTAGRNNLYLKWLG